ncbi:MAG: B12-binding domain-containing radical SAM protein [Planctomycetaceae bacterium]
MELPRRDRHDVYLPDGGYRRMVRELQGAGSAHDWSIVLAYPFDNRTRLMPFRWVDRRLVPCGVRSLAASLFECGFHRVRTVLQQWTPNFLPSAAVKAGHKIDLLLISSMGLHAEKAYRWIKDAHTLGADRPLIAIGGPKAIYEPEDGFGLGEEVVGAGVDLACTGEEYVLLNFLQMLAEEAGATESPLRAFERLRSSGCIDDIPGLVYRAPDCEPDRPFLINTGVQRLVRDLDELPMPLAGMTCIEPAHRKRTLKPKSWPLKNIRRKAFLASLVSTHGCRFNCDFCPIPAYQQRTWRHKSPHRMAAEIKQLAEEMQYYVFFGTDDNFFNDRGSVTALMEGMAAGSVNGKPFRKAIHFSTEATEFDVYKNRDLLPLAADAGLKTIFFGIEDLNAKLINKGQTVNKTQELFAEMRRAQVAPYAMMIHHDDQPFWSRKPDQLGVVNQAMRLFDMGAVGYHSTYITPSMGARNVETMYGAGNVFAEVGGRKLPEAFQDGNHVVASRHDRPWVRQLQLWAAYYSYYNPVNLMRTIFSDLRQKFNRRRLKWQTLGNSMFVPTLMKMLPYTIRLSRGVEKHAGTPDRCLPMIDAHSRERVKWGIDSDVPYEVYPDLVQLPSEPPLVELRAVS